MKKRIIDCQTSSKLQQLTVHFVIETSSADRHLNTSSKVVLSPNPVTLMMLTPTQIDLGTLLTCPKIMVLRCKRLLFDIIMISAVLTAWTPNSCNSNNSYSLLSSEILTNLFFIVSWKIQFLVYIIPKQFSPFNDSSKTKRRSCQIFPHFYKRFHSCCELVIFFNLVHSFNSLVYLSIVGYIYCYKF